MSAQRGHLYLKGGIILVKIKCIWITDWRFANRHLLKLEHGQSSTHKFINPSCQQPPSAVTPQSSTLLRPHLNVVEINKHPLADHSHKSEFVFNSIVVSSR
ncbi:hypothetical protein L2E82_44567 [Cichorium intybus]|uniref:Uncharacterized protein n=1 Tax=Cichorium intybus TaxID=13427 RepID=A0ACB8ZQW2_CICIN|nr:hypothetical protein L2E82_44567 [Cichorium intybus]